MNSGGTATTVSPVAYECRYITEEVLEPRTMSLSPLSRLVLALDRRIADQNVRIDEIDAAV